jgi:hypothetical protein
LHLASTAVVAIDHVAAQPDAPDDIDGDLRPIGSASDVGADEYGIPAPAAVTDLRVTQAVTSTGELTATLHWTAPSDAVTATLRYLDTFITKANWDGALSLDDALPGSTEVYTAVVPYSSGTIYFALKTQGVGGTSNLSNNAFWPYLDVYVPLLLK